MKETAITEIQSNQKLILASNGLRLGNSLIDTIVFFLIIFLHAMILDAWLGIIEEGGSDWFVPYFFLVFILYYTIFEHFFGKTIGKFITKTKVVKKDGSKPAFLNTLGRNAARLIPFDALTYLFSERGLHDQASNTYVVINR